MDNQLKDRILQEIAKSFPYPIEDVSSIYDRTHSFDATIKACEAAVAFGFSRAIGVFSFPKIPGPSETK
jgi:hypothetical protein